MFECVGVGVYGVIIVFYIVLVEGDEESDLIVEEVCFIVDGYIVFLCK